MWECLLLMMHLKIKTFPSNFIDTFLNVHVTSRHPHPQLPSANSKYGRQSLNFPCTPLHFDCLHLFLFLIVSIPHCSLTLFNPLCDSVYLQNLFVFTLIVYIHLPVHTSWSRLNPWQCIYGSIMTLPFFRFFLIILPWHYFDKTSVITLLLLFLTPARLYVYCYLPLPSIVCLPDWLTSACLLTLPYNFCTPAWIFQ